MKRVSLCASAMLVVALMLRGSSVFADTITVHDLAQNPSTGVYTYEIQLDAAANVHTGDGFVIYDFPGLTSWTITGTALNSSQFTLNQSLTSNDLNQSSSVDAFGSVAASSNGLAFDNSTVNNLSYSYVGPPVPFLGATDAILTLNTSVHGQTDLSVYASVDHSGSDASHPFSFSANPVTVPKPSNATPLPAASLGGGLLLALLGLGQAYKARRARA